MGQKASSQEDASGVGGVRHARCCACSDQPRANRKDDTIQVTIVAPDLEAPVGSPSESRIQRQPPFGEGFGCGLGQRRGPVVEVVDILPRSAVVRWHWENNARPQQLTAYYVFLVRLPSCDPLTPDAKTSNVDEFFFARTAADAEELKLPEGTLERACYYYRAEVVAEWGAADPRSLSCAGVSEHFSTPPEPPGPVEGLTMVVSGESKEPYQSEIQLVWNAPVDDGGSQLARFEIVLLDRVKDSSVDDDAISAEKTAEHVAFERGVKQNQSVLDACDRSISKSVVASAISLQPRHTFTGLPPAAGPFWAEVRAQTIVGRYGPPSRVCVWTAVAAPGAVTELTATLLPALPPRANSQLCDTTYSDSDLVRLKFLSPLYDGGQRIVSFRVYLGPRDDGDIVDGKGSPMEFPAQIAEPGCQCTYDVPVAPNCAYTFFIEAWNGHRASALSTSLAASVFVPARVPAPPSSPPSVCLLEEKQEVGQGKSTFTAELRWEAARVGGGLPLEFFKIGVTSASAPSPHGELLREIAVSASDAALGGCFETSHKMRSRLATTEDSVSCLAQVQDLKANTRYRFVLAAANALGTGRWSPLSVEVVTAEAAPAAPTNAVSSVAPDPQDPGNVRVTVSWDLVQKLGSAPAAKFSLSLCASASTKAAAAAACDLAGAADRREIIAAQGDKGHRYSWSALLVAPGNYSLEIVAESRDGRRGKPLRLVFEAGEELFSNRAALLVAPHWAEEPLLLLGPAVSEPRGGAAEGATSLQQAFAGTPCKWLPALLLWNIEQGTSSSSGVATGSSTTPPNFDVICSFRHTGTGQALTIALATGASCSRLQTLLPTDVPLSLRLVARVAEKRAKAGIGKHAAQVKSEPLLLLLPEGGERLKPLWEVWARRDAAATDGIASRLPPPRWTPLPEDLQGNFETCFLEGTPRLTFNVSTLSMTVPVANEGVGACDLAPGTYEIIFGDERKTQHTVRRVRAGVDSSSRTSQEPWTANARRIVNSIPATVACRHSGASTEEVEVLCIICMEQKRTHAFMHNDTGDGHLAVCGSCTQAYIGSVAAQAKRTCPVCRRDFSALQRIYY